MQTLLGLASESNCIISVIWTTIWLTNCDLKLWQPYSSVGNNKKNDLNFIPRSQRRVDASGDLSGNEASVARGGCVYDFWCLKTMTAQKQVSSHSLADTRWLIIKSETLLLTLQARPVSRKAQRATAWPLANKMETMQWGESSERMIRGIRGEKGWRFGKVEDWGGETKERPLLHLHSALQPMLPITINRTMCNW